MSRAEKHLPEANEFSPGIVSLAKVLELVATANGDRAVLVEAIRQEYFAESAERQADPAKRLNVQRTRASNVLIGLKGYGLIESLDRPVLTPIGQALRAEPTDSLRLEAFARHILRSAHGEDVLEALRALKRRRIRPTKASLQNELERAGFRLPRATTHHTRLLQWLREAEVLSSAYEIDEGRLAELLGFASETLSEWRNLTRPQQALLRTLRQHAEIHGQNPTSAKGLVETCVEQHGAIFSGLEDKMSAQVYRPLADNGWVDLSGRGEGRGGKSGFIAATQKLLAVDLTFLGIESGFGIPPDLRARIDTPLEDIYQNLSSTVDYDRGIALELLALNMAVDLGLTPIGFRLRGTQTGGAEIDLVAEGAHLHFSRWSFQCKAVKSDVPLSALAKEIGMAILLKGHVIVMVTTAGFASSVQQHAEQVAATTALQVVLVDRNALAAYRAGGGVALREHFRRSATDTMQFKRGQAREAVPGDTLGQA